MTFERYQERKHGQRLQEDIVVGAVYTELSERGLRPLDSNGLLKMLQCIEELVPVHKHDWMSRVDWMSLVMQELASPELFGALADGPHHPFRVDVVNGLGQLENQGMVNRTLVLDGKHHTAITQLGIAALEEIDAKTVESSELSPSAN
jgi:hypothetical protein